MLPLAGVAAAYGPGVDPTYEVGLAAPMRSFGLLIRALAVLVTTTAMAGLAALALPGLQWTAAAWLMPSLGLTLASLALATRMPALVACGSLAVLWVLAAGMGWRLAQDRAARRHDTSTTTISISKLRKRYGSTDVVAGLTLSIGPGVSGLLGPNGAGKTTLMRMLATVLAPTDGRLRLLGLDPSDAEQRIELRRRLGYMPQEPGFHRQFTAFEFVDHVAILKEMTDTRARHREVRRVLEDVGLGKEQGRRIRKLSGGMRMRVALAQALLGDPQLLLLDEPTAAFDLEQRMRFRELASELGEGRTVLVATHQTADVAALCQRVIVLRVGLSAFDGTPAQLSALARDRVWVADTRDDRARLWWRTAEGRHRHIGDPPPSAQLVAPTIEDGYLMLAGPGAAQDAQAA